MSEHALEYALEAYPDAEITALTVVGEPSGMWGAASGLALADDLEEAAATHAAPIFDRARELVADADGDAEFETIVELGHPVRAILDHAEEYDTVVVGAHGGTLSGRLFVGNVAEKIVHRSPVPVTVVR